MNRGVAHRPAEPLALQGLPGFIEEHKGGDGSVLVPLSRVERFRLAVKCALLPASKVPREPLGQRTQRAGDAWDELEGSFGPRDAPLMRQKLAYDTEIVARKHVLTTLRRELRGAMQQERVQLERQIGARGFWTLATNVTQQAIEARTKASPAAPRSWWTRLLEVLHLRPRVETVDATTRPAAGSDSKAQGPVRSLDHPEARGPVTPMIRLVRFEGSPANQAVQDLVDARRMIPTEAEEAALREEITRADQSMVGSTDDAGLEVLGAAVDRILFARAQGAIGVQADLACLASAIARARPDGKGESPRAVQTARNNLELQVLPMVWALRSAGGLGAEGTLTADEADQLIRDVLRPRSGGAS